VVYECTQAHLAAKAADGRSQELEALLNRYRNALAISEVLIDST